MEKILAAAIIWSCTLHNITISLSPTHNDPVLNSTPPLVLLAFFQGFVVTGNILRFIVWRALKKCAPGWDIIVMMNKLEYPFIYFFQSYCCTIKKEKRNNNHDHDIGFP